AAAGRALAAAGLAAAAPETRAGIVLGTAFGCFLTNAAYQRRLAAEGPPGASPRLFAATVSNAAAGELAIAYRLAGPAVTVTAGGASGLAALGEAIELIRAGRADVVVAGAPPPLAALEDRALAAMPGDRRLSPKTVFGETLGAAGPLALLAALAEAEPGLPVLVLDACPSGHVAALVARASEAR